MNRSNSQLLFQLRRNLSTTTKKSKRPKPPKPSFLDSYSPLFQLDTNTSPIPYKLILPPTDFSFSKLTLGTNTNTQILCIPASTLTSLTTTALTDVSYLLRPSHLRQLRSICDDPDASSNDKFVALELLKNANVASGKILPSCQDTGTAIIMGKKGANVYTYNDTTQEPVDDTQYLAEGVYNAYDTNYLRYSQVTSTNMFKEQNTGTNLPAQIDIFHDTNHPNEYNFLFMAKGGGSANKTFLHQQSKALLTPEALEKFLKEHVSKIGTSACPPYHLAIVIGGLSAELNLKTVKLASAGYYDALPHTGDSTGRAYRDREWEEKILELTRQMGIGAQFGGKYFCHDVKVVRLPRHGASCPVGIGVSCSADRQIKGKIDEKGVWVEQLETDVGQYLPDVTADSLDTTQDVIHIDLNSMSMTNLRQKLSKLPLKSRLSLSGTIIVMRDIAHAKILEQLNKGTPLPSYVTDHVIYYAGPAKTPTGYASGSFGPTTAGRMDSYVPTFMKNGGSFVTLAKGNRSKGVTKACKEYGGFYLGSIGGPGAVLAKNCIEKVEVWDLEEEGMEAVWKIEVKDFPAFVVVDDKGGDFFSDWLG